MIKIFVDSGSSIKQEEKERYGVEILPLKILINDVEYSDGLDITCESFYDLVKQAHTFPKTSLPSLDEAHERVMKYVNSDYDVVIITISSQISGTFNALKMLFNEEPKVKVVDSKSAVGGIRILVNEANKHLDKPVEQVVDMLNAIAPKITALAVPETLDNLRKGGRLSATGWAVGSLLKIKPIIELKNGVAIKGKVIGLKSAMKFLIKALNNCNTNYPIIPSYTFDDKNLNELLSKTPDNFIKVMGDKDNLTPAIACHWGANAFGYVFVEK